MTSKAKLTKKKEKAKAKAKIEELLELIGRHK